MSNSIKYTEKELKALAKKNPKIKISAIENSSKVEKILVDKNSQKPQKISIDNTIIKPIKEKKSTGAIKTSEVIHLNKTAEIKTSYSNEHFSLLFKGARLLTINKIFSMLQVKGPRFELFNYKKSWHVIISELLNEEFSKNKQLPFFDDTVEITLFRQAPRLVDEDALSTMFKYIIDALKKSPDNPHGIIAEDNPKIVHRIISHSEKGEYYVGIKIRKIKVEDESIFTPDQILEN